MSVNSIDSVRNTMVATGTTALVGAGVGATYGLMSKPYMEGLVPSDKFMRKSLDNLTKSSDEGVKNISTFIKECVNTIQSANTGSDLAPISNKLIDTFVDNFPDSSIKKSIIEYKKICPEELKGIMSNIDTDGDDVVQILKRTLDNFGDKVPTPIREVMGCIDSKQDVATIFKPLVQFQLKQLSIPELKNSLHSAVKLLGTNILAASQILKDNEETLNPQEKEVAKAIKSAAKSITRNKALKLAAIDGGILGLATFFGMNYINKQQSKPTMIK